MQIAAAINFDQLHVKQPLRSTLLVVLARQSVIFHFTYVSPSLYNLTMT